MSVHRPKLTCQRSHEILLARVERTWSIDSIIPVVPATRPLPYRRSFASPRRGGWGESTNRGLPTCPLPKALVKAEVSGDRVCGFPPPQPSRESGGESRLETTGARGLPLSFQRGAGCSTLAVSPARAGEGRVAGTTGIMESIDQVRSTLANRISWLRWHVSLGRISGHEAVRSSRE